MKLRVCSYERRNELIPVWDFKPTWEQVVFTWSFISAAFQNDPIFWWTCVGISFRVVSTWYFIIRNEISFLSKWPISNPYPHCFSNAHTHWTQHPTSMRLFISFRVNYVHKKILCRFEISFRSKRPIWNPHRFRVSFCLNSCEHNQKADWTQKWDFQPKWNLVWTYSKFWFHELFLIKIKKTHWHASRICLSTDVDRSFSQCLLSFKNNIFNFFWKCCQKWDRLACTNSK